MSLNESKAILCFSLPGQARDRRSSPLGVAAQLASNRWLAIAIGVAAQMNVEAKILHTSTIQKSLPRLKGIVFL